MYEKFKIKIYSFLHSLIKSEKLKIFFSYTNMKKMPSLTLSFLCVCVYFVCYYSPDLLRNVEYANAYIGLQGSSEFDQDCL